MQYPKDFINKIICGDCLDVMKDIPEKSIDCIICDLPYGLVSCTWDVVIPFDKLWEQYKRVIKDNAAIVLFGSQPFTTDLIMSNRKWFKYEWIWEKNRGSNFVNFKYMPFKQHENICIFAKNKTKYNPQKVLRTEKGLKRFPKGNTEIIKRKNLSKSNITNMELLERPAPNTEFKNAISVLKYNCVNPCDSMHPTQKPVAILEYLVRTYTNEGDLILDNCIGSGSTGVAALNCKRNFIGIEKEAKYCEIARKRISTTNYVLFG